LRVLYNKFYVAPGSQLVADDSPVTLQSKRYKSAPITEAVIEIRLQPPASPDLSTLEGLARSLERDFPKRLPMHLVEVSVTAPENQAPSETFSQAQIGFRLTKADDSRVLQLRRDGLAYSHLAPYTEWGHFRAEAEPLWQKYRAVYPDAKPTRCALRYINRIDIPQIPIEIEDYFQTYPMISKKLPQQDTVGVTLEVQMPQRDLDCMAVIRQLLVGPVKPNHISIVLDVDIFRMGIESWSDSEIWAFLDRLRVRKNEIFEACITDRTRELIDQ